MNALLFSDAEGTGHPDDVARVRNDVTCFQPRVAAALEPGQDPHGPAVIQIQRQMNHACGIPTEAERLASSCERVGLDHVARNLREAAVDVAARHLALARELLELLEAHPDHCGHRVTLREWRASR